MIFIKLTLESLRFAWGALTGNLLRTILSLLGVTIGIFAIISVFTLVDSLEESIKESFDFLGSNNINVEKWPYGLSDDVYPWWKYLKRPYVTYDEYEYLKENTKNATAICIFMQKGGVIAKHESNSSNNRDLMGILHSHKDVYDFEIENGRYFTENEVSTGRNAAILGHTTAKELFPNGNPLGKEVKIRGLKFNVIGILKEEGEPMLGMPTNDDAIYLPFHAFRKMYYSGRKDGVEPIITLKGKTEDIGLVELEAELQGLMRRKRGLKPKEEDDFALNRPDAIKNLIGSVFDVFGVAGWVIGGFSILVGGFGIANIMFVSVRERTNIIGIQKSLGAKNYFILFQFLFESVFLSLIGGLLGLIFVFGISQLDFGELKLTLSMANITLGIGVSVAIGTISGIVPAVLAARMDPVLAIRMK